ncbi:MAG: PAS domain S-box protein [Burkholderiales bacterium]|nr:PAS domain S-box protein [Burkholderiales bacterium]
MKINNQIVVSLAGATAMVALVVAASLWAYGHLNTAADARQQSYDLIIRAEAMLSGLTDAESAQRGYLLTGDDAFLGPYLVVHDRVRGDLEALRPLTQIGASVRHLDSLVPMVDAKLAHMAQIIALRRDRGIAAVLEVVGKGASSSGNGKRLMDSIRAEMTGLLQSEQDALARHEAEFQSNMRRMFASIITISMLALLFALAFAYLSFRQARQRLANLLHLETRRLLEIQEETNLRLRRANSTLQVSEAKLTVTLNSIGDGVIATDGEGRVTLLNPLAQKLTGWTQAEAAGRLVDDIFHIINQDTRLPSAIPVAKTLAHGTVQGLANHTILIARNGSECPIADCCAPIRDPDGKVAGAVLVFRDVTGEYAAAQALREHQLYTRSLFESNVDAIMTTDPSGIITDVNNQMEALTACPRDELIGTPFKDYFTDPARAAASIEQVLREKKVSNYELTAHARNGKETFVSYNATTFHNAAGELQGVFAAARDVTESKRLDRELKDKNVELESARAAAEKANLAKSDFLSNMSHELRTPLNAVLGFAQVIESGTPPPTPLQKRSVDEILKAGWYLLELINEILDLARIESGRLALSREPVSLNEVMLECQAMIEPQAQLRGIGMQFPRFDTPSFVLADRTRLKQVLINLFFNAVKYNRPDGKVVVECISDSPEALRISVSDTGAGLPAEKLAQLFQPFNRLGKETSIEEGTGIGLVVSKRLVELMGGTIGADSTVGEGSVFWIQLTPCAAPQLIDSANESAVPHQAPVASGTPLRTILYVEDNPANLRLVEELIARRRDLRMLSAADGNLGIELAREFMPDVILMDINLPGISGIDAMQILRANPTTAHIPIVAISANAIPGDIKKGMDAGFLRYLTKPVVINEFMDALGVALEVSATQAENKVRKETIQ